MGGNNGAVGNGTTTDMVSRTGTPAAANTRHNCTPTLWFFDTGQDVLQMDEQQRYVYVQLPCAVFNWTDVYPQAPPLGWLRHRLFFFRRFWI
jgi:hypothetical protein